MALLVSRWLGSSADLELWFAGARPSCALTYCRVLRDASLGFYAPYDALVLPSAKLATPLPLANPKLHDFLLRVMGNTATAYPPERPVPEKPPGDGPSG